MYGKPNPLVFQNAETILKQVLPSLHCDIHLDNHTNAGSHTFKTLYMIGDNPSVDICGARKVCVSDQNAPAHFFFLSPCSVEL